jgi:DNA-binding transcriptional ArsR family regulator
LLRLAGVEYIEADEIRRAPFRVALAPLPSLQAALIDAVGTGRKGTPAAWRRAIRAHLRDRDRETLAPFVTRTQTLVPDALIGLPNPPGESLKDGIERMVATPEEELLEETEACRAATGSAAWRGLERDPARWLRGYVASLLRAWRGFGPIWRQAQTALDREVERIGVATALDAQLELLDGLVAQGYVADGRWCLTCKFAQGRKELPETGLVLLPMVAGDGASILDVGETRIRYVGYPVRGLGGIGADDRPAAALECLLGPPRAQILRAVECPTSVGRLAETLRAVPSAATHHVTALEAAGLVTRERAGRHVLVRRTARGEALLELYRDSGLAQPKGRALAVAK